jgi:hypothetical protein
MSDIRPEVWTKEAAAPRAVPHLWSIFDDARDAALTRGERWPGYVWMPFEKAGGKIVEAFARRLATERISGEQIMKYMPYVAVNAYTLATWRLGKGIYRFDPDLQAEIMRTPVTGQIPTDVLKRLPEWCVYVETPGFSSADGLDIKGFFANISRENGQDRLVISIDMTDPHKAKVIPTVPITLGLSSIEEALRVNVLDGIQTSKKMRSQGLPLDTVSAQMLELGKRGGTLDNAIVSVLADVGPLLSLILYLCADDREIENGIEDPPQPTKTKHGLRFFAAPAPRLIDVGLRLGARLREARRRAEHSDNEGGAGRIPHLRRAHWHTYLYGSRSLKQERRLRWLHPILVNDEERDENMPAVLHPVTPASTELG